MHHVKLIQSTPITKPCGGGQRVLGTNEPEPETMRCVSMCSPRQIGRTAHGCKRQCDSLDDLFAGLNHQCTTSFENVPTWPFAKPKRDRLFLIFVKTYLLQLACVCYYWRTDANYRDPPLGDRKFSLRLHFFLCVTIRLTTSPWKILSCFE